MTTPLEVIKKGEQEFEGALFQYETVASKDGFSEQYPTIEYERGKVFLKRQTLALLQALHDELEGKKKVEKQIHTPNCMRGTSTTGHSYCSMSEEDEGYNQAIMEITTELDELMSRIATG